MRKDYRRIDTFKEVQPLRGGKKIVKFTDRNQMVENEEQDGDLAKTSRYIGIIGVWKGYEEGQLKEMIMRGTRLVNRRRCRDEKNAI